MYTKQYLTYILIILSIILIYIFFTSKEKFMLNFSTNNQIIKKQNYNLTCILPFIIKDGFLGVFKDKDTKAINTLIQTHNLKGNNWTSVCNGELPNGDKIHQLFWYKYDYFDCKIKKCKDKQNKYPIKLMCIGKNINNQYTIHIKEDTDIKSKWIEFKINNNKLKNNMISFIIYDLNNNLLGINDSNNQIYKLNKLQMEWVGPINYSNIKIKRIIYDLDKKMLGLDIDNKIWKKENIRWDQSNWKHNSNNEYNYINYKDKQNNNKFSSCKNILDLIHDKDGKLIGVTDEDPNIIKQIDFTFSSVFSNYYKEQSIQKLNQPNLESIDIINKILLTKNDIITNKIGLSIDDYEYIKLVPDDDPTSKNKNSLITKLNFLLEFKKKFLNECKYKHKTTTFNKNNSETYNEINNLIDSIDNKDF